MDSFEPHIRQELDRFSEYLSNLEEDYIILMARKAIRLYELLIAHGARGADNIVLSQRVLDENLDWAEDKSIAIVDDTLIVGTTINDCVVNLQSANAAVINTYVFCIDKDYWVEDYIKPKKFFLKMTDREVMSFCAAEVLAFEKNGIPYISDFPVSEEISIDNICTLALVPKWRSYSITTKNQEIDGRHVITFLPDGDLHSEIEENLGANFYNLIDILKIRVLGRTDGSIVKFKIIPIFTLKPLTAEDLCKLFVQVIDCLNEGGKLDSVYKRLVSLKGKLRCIQYIFSIIFGRIFMENFGWVSKSRQSIDFNENEIFRNYGPWLLDEFRYITASAKKKIWKKSLLRISDIKPSKYPTFVTDIVKKESVLSNLDSNNSNNIITDVSRLFLRLHKDHELPARKEAMEQAISGGNLSKSHHRDRLKVGFPWQLIVEYLCKIYNKQVSTKYSNLFSLALDFWNDKGVSVPIICVKDGIVFRAYRHGESAPYSNQEAGLCWLAINSYLEAREKTTIGHTELLKLLVILFRSGMSNDYIDVITGCDGSAGVARIGYHLHGAIPFITDDQNNLYADNKEQWITRYLMAQGAISKNTSGYYHLAEQPVANYHKPDSENHANDLGLFLGHLMNSRDKDNNVLLTSQDLIKIATCCDLASVISAVNAELRIVGKDYNKSLKHNLRRIDLSSKTNVRKILANLRGSDLYTAMQSAKMKVLAYEHHEIKNILERCETYFSLQVLGSAQVRSWQWLMKFCKIDTGNESCKDLLPTHKVQTHQLIFLFSAIYTIEYSLLNLIRESHTSEFKKIFRLLEKKVSDVLNDFSEEDAPHEQEILVRLQANMNLTADPGDFDSIRSFNWALSILEGKSGELNDQIAITSRTLADHNTSIEPRTYFDHVFWYDIVDSTGTKYAKVSTADKVRAYKANVSRFRDSVSRRLATICDEYSSDGNEVLPWNGTVESKNDEKHIFFTGKDKVIATIKTIAALLILAKQCPGVRFRAALIPCNFTCDSYASSSQSSAEVEGEVFLTHFDRLKKGIHEEESKLNDSDSRIFIAEQFRREFFKELKRHGMYGDREFNIVTTEGVRNNRCKLLGANI